jgi:butyryl-CoA dehydrogenase
LVEAIDAYAGVVDYIAANYNAQIRSVFAGSVPYLKLAGITHGGWQMARAALAAARNLRTSGADTNFLKAKIATARFFADHMLTAVPGLGKSVVHGAAGALALPEEAF